MRQGLPQVATRTTAARSSSGAATGRGLGGQLGAVQDLEEGAVQAGAEGDGGLPVGRGAGCGQLDGPRDRTWSSATASSTMPSATASVPPQRWAVMTAAWAAAGGSLAAIERGHAGGQGHAHVGLGQAPVAPVVPHDPGVVGHGDHRPGREGVAVQGGHRVDGQAQQPGEQAQGVGDDLADRAVLDQPLEGEAVRIELAGPGGDQGGRAGRGLDLVERGVPLGHRVAMEPVVVVDHREDEDVAAPPRPAPRTPSREP